jgi:hypothetical protein
VIASGISWRNYALARHRDMELLQPSKIWSYCTSENKELTAQHDETAIRNTCGDCIQAKYGVIAQWAVAKYGVFLVHQKTCTEATGSMEASRQNIE